MKYEIHITIHQPKSIESFKKACEELNVKPIVIATGNYDQVMTSSIYDKSLTPWFTAIEQAEFISHNLESKGFTVIRQKIEIEPRISQHKDFIYYEAHLRIKIPKDRLLEDQEKIDRLCNDWRNFHKSRNLFKIDEEYAYQMVTYRTDGGFWDFGKHVNDTKSLMEYYGLWVDKCEFEECIYDTNQNVDKPWLENKDTASKQLVKEVSEKLVTALDKKNLEGKKYVFKFFVKGQFYGYHLSTVGQVTQDKLEAKRYTVGEHQEDQMKIIKNNLESRLKDGEQQNFGDHIFSELSKKIYEKYWEGVKFEDVFIDFDYIDDREEPHTYTAQRI